jgi:hypothetical protein
MDKIKSRLWDMLDARADEDEESLTRIANESGIDRTVLTQIRNKKRGFSVASIEKMSIYFGMSISMAPVRQSFSIPDSECRRVPEVFDDSAPLPEPKRRCGDQGGNREQSA